MPKDAAVEEFSARLRALKARGGRSYEALGRRLNVSASTLHRYCSGATVPERFTVIDRMARLCGADEDEHRNLEELWTRADRSRRPIPQEREPEPEPEPDPQSEPEVQESEHAPEPEPEVQECERAPEPQPEEQESERAPELAALDTLTTAPAPRAARSRSRSWRGALVAGAGAAVVALALVLVLVRPGLPTGPEATAPPTPTTPPSTPAESAPPPFTWTADSQVWQDGCGHVYLVDRGPRGFGPPPPPGDAATWAGAKAAVHGGETRVRISLQGRSPSSAVVLQALHVRVVGRAQPLPWTAYRMDNGCGGAVTPRHFAVDLDRPRPLARPVDGYDASGAEGRTIPAVSFPYAVTSADPEELLVTARTAGCDCRWYLELVWSSEGRTGTVRIGDGGGKPFRTSGIEGRPVHEYDPVGRRWITGADSGQSG
ncbi:hypothetical protein ASC82_02720 [Streptomyces sp. Root431]|uniref:helix-turn-helix domain-containing protein n=1 Tax=Streptomyces sp. Root431 TaxID=1736535 RepID=UPI0006F3C80E|nr:helix-turn-helix transcriptional regulator [Streptomyces sp. Root431]KQX17150.1 hypothetical protein ASC82_02720 [Streptomyces sp. Root431]